MISKELLYYEYEQILIGNKTGFSPYYFKYGDNLSANYVYEIMKFAFEVYLKQSPEDIRDHFNKEISELMKLEPLMKYIDFPEELDKGSDYFYIAALLYPQQIKFNEKELILRTFNRVLNGSLKKFPKEYFAGTRGSMRAGICLQYMLNQHYTFENTQALYKFFAGPNGLKALKEYRLNSICNEMFDTPIDYLHDSLPTAQKDEWWYHYYKFIEYDKKMLKKEAKDDAVNSSSENHI